MLCQVCACAHTGVQGRVYMHLRRCVHVHVFVCLHTLVKVRATTPSPALQPLYLSLGLWSASGHLGGLGRLEV